MNTSAVGGLASVIIPCWNQVEFTRKCISALMRHAGPNWELIVVNNGSSDGTADYLGGVQDVSPVPVTVIANGTNRGFPAAVNQGLQYARGEYLVLLNNDVVVTDGWLEQLIALAGAETGAKPGIPSSKSEAPNPKSEMGIGLVGPMSNYAAPPQLVADVPYRDLEEMKAFARRCRDEHRGEWFTVQKLSGFCLLMKRAVYEAIGGLDERFGLGFFDDDDLAERARRAGFGLAVAHDLFVHHYGSRTFVGNGIDADRVLDENARRFAAKWGDGVPQGRRVALRTWQNGEGAGGASLAARPALLGAGLPTPPVPRPKVSPASTRQSELNGSVVVPGMQEAHPHGPDVRLKPNLLRARVSLTMIVKNEEANLSTCLESVHGVFDEIVVLDTGSKDRTVEIARSFGARVFDFVWVDDFAAARNAALARARGEYAFWLDADDLIEAPERGKLETLFGQLRRGGTMPAYVVRCSCDPGPDGAGGETVVDHIRLFPLIEGVRWTYRVHEQILPALKRAGVPVEWTDITVRHTGYSDRELRFRKLDRDCRILREELAERPDDPFTLFNLGSIAIEKSEWNEALGYLKPSLAGSAPTDSIVRKLYALIARSYQMLRDYPAALSSCSEGLSLDPEDAELWFRKAVVHRSSGQPAEAEKCWRRILTLSRPRKFASLDQGIYGHLTRRNLAALAQERGDVDEAQRQWRAVLAECPEDKEARRHLGEAVSRPDPT
jgi:glycosyltransferase involved in cell wall biosynthesis